MKRRDFLVQTMSASAVVLGTGTASLDILLSRPLNYEPSVEDRATRAAAKVMVENNPTMDEGVASHSHQEALPKPEKAQSRPAEAVTNVASSQSNSVVADEIKQPTQDVEPEVIAEEVVLDKNATQVENLEIAKPEGHATSVLEKQVNFDINYLDDVILTEAEYLQLVQTLERINRVQDWVGFGNFNILSFDDALKFARSSPRIGEFTEAELAFMEQLFSFESARLGFLGEKVIDQITHVVNSKDVFKVPRSGHYVYRGESEAFYNRLRGEVGEELILTSGVRSIMKQYQLFLAKTVQASGNMSRAARSLAPPGHSYHAIGDFDVGRVGGGLSNFSSEFADTSVFKKLQNLGYVQIRYTEDNEFGVRYEPWHIRVV